MKRVLITGGAGFIGMNLIKEFLQSNEYGITVLDSFIYSANQDIEKVYPEIIVIRDTICNQVLMSKLVQEVDGIIHMAAEAHVDRISQRSKQMADTNIYGTLTILDALREHNKKCRLLHVSTDEVYGSAPYSIGDDIGRATEKTKLYPTNYYALTKSTGDQMVQLYQKMYGLNTVIVRPVNNYGPFQYPEKLVPFTITRFMTNKPALIYGTGENRRCWLYVEDTCRIIRHLFEEANVGSIYNISGPNVSNLELIETLSNIIGGLTTTKMIKDRVLHDFEYNISDSLLRSDFYFHGEIQTVSLDIGLINTVKWYENNDKWLQKIINEPTYQQWLREHYKLEEE